MKYDFAYDLQVRADEISKLLFPHVKVDRLRCLRSQGTSSKYIIARCHTICKVTQKALGIPAHYILEFLCERFDKLDFEEQTKVIIHELMHIPKTFGGGFKHHDYVTERNVNKHYKMFKDKKNEKKNNFEL